MKWFIVLIVLILSCTIDMTDQTIYKKSEMDSNGRKCRYETWGTWPGVKFYADCDCYDVGDSLNKWYRQAQKNSMEALDTTDNSAMVPCDSESCGNKAVYHLCKECVRKDAAFYAQHQ